MGDPTLEEAREALALAREVHDAILARLPTEVRDWLARAGEDLREAECDLAAVPPLLRGAVFHCQQAAEVRP